MEQGLLERIKNLLGIGKITIQSVIPDGNDANSPPPQPLPAMIAKVDARDGSIANFGTAFAIGDGYWMTSAHVVNRPTQGFDAKTIQISPAFKKGLFSNPKFFEAERILHPSWDHGEPIKFDVAMLYASNAPQPARPFLLIEAKSAHKDHLINVSGYPRGKNAHYHIMPLLSLRNEVLEYQNDTQPEQSGGPVILWPENAATRTLQVIGVHCEGTPEAPMPSSKNRAMALRQEILVWINIEKSKKIGN